MKSYEKKAKAILAQLTLEEKAGLCSGKNFWCLKDIERLGVDEVMVTDGPHGLRKQAGAADHLGLNASVPATCFPPAVTSASSWDPEATRAMGRAIGQECQQENVAVVLGPGVNIKRSPLCGRNFEYFSEDPCLAGAMGAGWVQGVQENGVGTSLKHFAANNQEKARLVSNSVIDERALREIYLAPFERVVRDAQPYTVMCSYNRVNGTYACENPRLLTHRLRDDWGFEGLVVTDWGAMDQRVAALEAGLDLEMPGPSGDNDQAIVDAVRSGTLDPAVLDRTALRILKLILRWKENHTGEAYDVKAHHALACRIAEESTVLLRNENRLLPLSRTDDFAVIGAFAEKPRYQGAGSSRINPTQVDTLLDALKQENVAAPYAPGYSLDPKAEQALQEQLRREAVELAKQHKTAVVCVGLPEEYESEGFDRSHINLPEVHNRLVQEIAAVCSHVVVVLMCGSAVALPWRNEVESILLPYLGGQAGGSALCHVLLGQAEPGGRLAETFPLKLEDTPAYKTFAKPGENVEYRESVLVGYGYYDWAGKEVQYPFGHGLSYTDFALKDLTLAYDHGCKAEVTLVNTGDRAGSQVVQLYLGKEDSALLRAPRRLKAFKKVTLNPGESCRVALEIPESGMQVYLADQGRWAIENGKYRISLGFSSRNLPLTGEITVDGETFAEHYRYTPEETLQDGIFAPTREQFTKLYGRELPLIPADRPYDMCSTIGSVMANPVGRQALDPIVAGIAQAMGAMGGDMNTMVTAMFADMPLRSLIMFSGGAVSAAMIGQIIAALNAARQ